MYKCVCMCVCLKIYPCIHGWTGLVKKKYDHYTRKTIRTKIKATFPAHKLILKNFLFKSKFNLQIKSCAMGTICVPSYADIFMSEFEERYIYPLFKNKSVIYLPYIDKNIMHELNPKAN